MSGRPKKPTGRDAPRLLVRTTPEVLAGLHEMAEAQGQTLTAVVLDACRRYLADWKGDEQSE